jgi:uncharacterized protein
MASAASFALWVREPEWATPVRLQLNGQPVAVTSQKGWLQTPVRNWADGDRVTLTYSLGASLVTGQYGDADHVALRWGPFVLAYDQARNPGMAAPQAIGLAEAAKPPFVRDNGDDLVFHALVRSRRATEPRSAVFLPFADAGATGGAYRVWLRAPGVAGGVSDSLLADGQESRSRQGNQPGSINDSDYGSFVVTYDNAKAASDWYAIALSGAAQIKRIVFAHGRCFHDGGWFDASAGKPRVQVQREKNGAWVTVGELTTYPSTTTTDPQGLKDGQKFTLSLTDSVSAWAVRVMGTPSAGDRPNQAFSSCAELEAFAQ